MSAWPTSPKWAAFMVDAKARAKGYVKDACRAAGLGPCEHKRRALKWFITSSGARCYCWQCIACGSSSAIAKKSLTTIQIAEAGKRDSEKYRALAAERTATWRRMAPQVYEAQRYIWWDAYNEYLASPEWAERRRYLIAAQPFCAECGSAASLQAHHLTYERVGDEAPGDLRVLCKDCHERVHEMEALDE